MPLVVKPAVTLRENALQLDFHIALVILHMKQLSDVETLSASCRYVCEGLTR